MVAQLQSEKNVIFVQNISKLSLILALFSIEIAWYRSHFLCYIVDNVNKKSILSIHVCACYDIHESVKVGRNRHICRKKKVVTADIFSYEFCI